MLKKMNASFVFNLIVYYKGETVECIINILFTFIVDGCFSWVTHKIEYIFSRNCGWLLRLKWRVKKKLLIYFSCGAMNNEQTDEYIRKSFGYLC